MKKENHEEKLLVMEVQSVINFVSPQRGIKKLIVNFVVRYYLQKKKRKNLELELVLVLGYWIFFYLRDYE